MPPTAWSRSTVACFRRGGTVSAGMAEHRIGGRHLPSLRLVRPGPYLQAFRELVELLSARRRLTYELARREVSAEHNAKRLGIFWGLFQPLFLLAVYAFIYGVVFRVRIGDTYELPRNYT